MIFKRSLLIGAPTRLGVLTKGITNKAAKVSKSGASTGSVLDGACNVMINGDNLLMNGDQVVSED